MPRGGLRLGVRLPSCIVPPGSVSVASVIVPGSSVRAASRGHAEEERGFMGGDLDIGIESSNAGVERVVGRSYRYGVFIGVGDQGGVGWLVRAVESFQKEVHHHYEGEHAVTGRWVRMVMTLRGCSEQVHTNFMRRIGAAAF